MTNAIRNDAGGCRTRQDEDDFYYGWSPEPNKEDERSAETSIPTTSASARKTTIPADNVEAHIHDMVGSWADANVDATAQSFQAGNEMTVYSPEQLPAVMKKISTDIQKTRNDLAKTDDPKEKQALTTRLAGQQAGWCQAATLAGLKPPGLTFDPRHCSLEELQNARQWAELGDCYPASALQSMNGPAQYRASLQSAWSARMQGPLTQSSAKNERAALENELVRLGDKTPCKEGDTIDTLKMRRTALLAAAAEKDSAERAKQAEADAKQLYMGLDGRVGTKEQVAAYESMELIKTAVGTTTTGSILANITFQKTGDIGQMRKAGELGDAIQGPLRALTSQVEKNQKHVSIGSTQPAAAKTDAAEIRPK